MTIFERIKQKANQALQNAGNFIDRDPNIGGVQLAKGGLINNTKNFFQDAYNDRPIAPQNYQGSNLQQNIQGATNFFNGATDAITQPRNTANRILDYQSPGMKTSLREAIKQTAPTVGTDFANTVSGRGTFWQDIPGVNKLLDFNGSYIAKPIGDIPKNIGTMADPNASKLDKGIAGLSTAGAFLPGVDDALIASYFAGKEKLAGSNRDALKPEYESSPLGDILRNKGYDGTGADLLDVAELPLLFGGVVLSGGKGADNLAKRSDEAGDVIKNLTRVDGAAKRTDDIVSSQAAVDKSATVTQKGDNFFQSLRKSKDVNLFDKIRLDRQSRLEKALPKNVYSKIKTNIVDPKNKLIADSIDWGKKYEDILSNLPIKMGGKEDKLIKQLNAGTITEKQLIQQVGEVKAKQIIDAHTQLRGMYDEMIAFINPRRVEAGLTEIPYKKDFLSQIGSKRSGNMVENLFFGKDKNTGTFSQGIFNRQGATNEDYGAIEGMVSYLDYAKRAGFTDLVTPKLDEYINLAGKAGADPSVVKYLENYRNEILGIRDSGLGDQIASLTGNVRGAAVLGNARSLLAQSYNLPQAIAETNPKNFIKGMFSKTARQAEKQSPLLKSLSDKTPMNLTKGFDKIKKPAADALQQANNVTAKQIWRSFYEQGKSKGVDDAVQYADDLTVQIMGDRRLAELGEYYQSWFGKTFSPFTLENQAGMNRLFKSVGEKKVGTVIGTLAAWKISNDLIENYGTGDRPFFDPVEMFNDVYEQWYGSDKKEPDKAKALARVFTEVTRLVPVLQSPFFTGAKLALGDKTRDIFGTEDPTWMNALSLYDITDVGRNITGNKAIDVPWNLASKVTPYTNQAARSTQALISQGRGYTESRKGNPMFETPKNAFDQARAIFFGQNSTKEARDMFENEFDWGLTTKQSDIINQIPSKDDKLEYLRNTKKSNISDKRLESMLNTASGGSAVDIDSSLFGDNKTTSKSVKERMDAYKELNKIISDENIPQSAKDEFIKASGADPKEVAYYTMAAQDVDVKLQEEILPKLDNMSNEEMMNYLGSQRRVVGGKQMLTSTMIDYLFDRDYISKAQSKALKALKYDEIKEEFYYKGGTGGGDLTYKQALKAFQIDLPKFSKLKSLDLMFEPISGNTSQTVSQGNILLSNLLNSKPKNTSSSNSKLWFNT